MPKETTLRTREPMLSVDIHNPKINTVYLLPTAHDGNGRPAYMGADAILIKQAAANGVPVVYAVPEEQREFVEHFSAGIELITLAVAVINLAPSTIQGIYALIQLAGMRKGIKEEDLGNAEVYLKIDYLKTEATEARGIEICGDCEGVVEVMKNLSA